MAAGTFGGGRGWRDIAAVGPVLHILPLARSIFAIRLAETTLLAHHVKSGDLVLAEMPGFIQEHLFRGVLQCAPRLHHDDGAVRITAVLPGGCCNLAVNDDNGFAIGVLRRAKPPECSPVISWQSDAVHGRRRWIFGTRRKNSESETRGNKGGRAPGHDCSPVAGSIHRCLGRAQPRANGQSIPYGCDRSWCEVQKNPPEPR